MDGPGSIHPGWPEIKSATLPDSVYIRCMRRPDALKWIPPPAGGGRRLAGRSSPGGPGRPARGAVFPRSRAVHLASTPEAAAPIFSWATRLRCGRCFPAAPTGSACRTLIRDDRRIARQALSRLNIFYKLLLTKKKYHFIVTRRQHEGWQ